MSASAIRYSLSPNVRQISDYTDQQVLPPVEAVEFRPGNGRGRPPKGREAERFERLEEVIKFLAQGAHRCYKQIWVKFVGDCHWFLAVVEQVFEKTMLVIPETGIVCVAAGEPC